MTDQFFDDAPSPLDLARQATAQRDQVAALSRSGGATMATRGTYSAAMQVQVPRELNKLTQRFLTECDLLGDAGIYGWGSGKDRVEGASVELALCLARNWGNCAVEPGETVDIGDSYIMNPAFVDLETGFTYGRPFKLSKRFPVHGRHDEFRKDDMRFGIGASKAARNVILKALPAFLVEQGIAQCKAGARSRLEKLMRDKGIAAVQDAALKRLATCGVPEAAVLAKFGVANRSALSLDHLVVCQGDVRAIDRGEQRPEDLYELGGSGGGDGATGNGAAANGGSKLDSFAAGAGTGGSNQAAGEQGTTGAAEAGKAPPEPPTPEPPTPEQVRASLQRLAQQAEVSWDAVEELLGPILEQPDPIASQQRYIDKVRELSPKLKGRGKA